MASRALSSSGDDEMLPLEPWEKLPEELIIISTWLGDDGRICMVNSV